MGASMFGLALLAAVPSAPAEAPAVPAPGRPVAEAVSAVPAPGRPVAEAVSVEGSDGCIGHADLAAQVAHWLGHDRVDARIAVHARVGPPGTASAGFTVRRDDAAVAERQLDFVQAACADRRTALALAIALAIDASVLDALLAAPPPVRPTPRPRLALSAVAEGYYTTGLVLGPAAAGFGGIEIGTASRADDAGPASMPSERLDGWLVRLGVLATGGSTAPLGTGRVGAALVAGRLDGCLARDTGRHAVSACLGAGVGRLVGQGHDFDSSTTTALLWAAAAGRVAAQVPLTRLLALRLMLEGMVPIVRPRLTVTTPAGEVLDARALPVAGLAVGAGLLVRLR